MRGLEGKEAENREWAFAGIIEPKKNKEIRLVIDFRPINDQLIWTKYLLATIDDILHHILGFNYVSNLDLNMVNLSMLLNYEARKILTLFIAFGLYECFVLPQGIKPVTDIFQGRMISSFEDMKKPPSVNFDDILVTSNTTFEDHLTILNEILKRLNNSGM